MGTQLADRDFYFPHKDAAITLRRVISNASEKLSHQHDLTEKEHHHNFEELTIILNGHGVHNIDGVNYPVTAGDVFVIHDKQKHYFHSMNSIEFINIMFIKQNMQLPEGDLRKVPGYNALFLLEPQYRVKHNFKSHLHLNRKQILTLIPIIDKIEAECNSETIGSQILLYSAFLELIVQLARAYSQPDTEEAKSLLRIGHIIGLLETEYTRKWGLEELLEIAHMSKSNFLRIFKKATQTSPVDYLTKVRIQRSMKLLRTTDSSIMQIAIAVGFEDSNYFTRRFKEINNVSPSAFRKI